MASESDVPLSVSATDKEGMDRYVTGTDLDQPFKANQLAQSEEIQASTSFQVENAISNFQDKSELPRDAFFSELPLAVKLATKQRVEGYQMDDIPREIEEEMRVNGKMIQKDLSAETPEEVQPTKIPVYDPNDAAEEKIMIGEGRDLSETDIPTLKQQELHCQSEGEKNLMEATIVEQNEADAKGESSGGGMQKNVEDGSSSPQMNFETGRMRDNEAEVTEDFSSLESSIDVIHAPRSTVSGQNIAEPTGELESEGTAPDKEDTPEQETVGQDATGGVEQKVEQVLHSEVNELVEGEFDSLSVNLATDVSGREAAGPQVDNPNHITCTQETLDNAGESQSMKERSLDIGDITQENHEDTALPMKADETCLMNAVETSTLMTETPSVDISKKELQEENKDEDCYRVLVTESMSGEEARDEIDTEENHHDPDLTPHEAMKSTAEELSLIEEEIRQDKHNDGATEGKDKIEDVPIFTVSKEVQPEGIYVHASDKFMEPISYAELDSQAGDQKDVVEEREDQNKETSLEIASEETNAPASKEHFETMSSAEVDFQEGSKEKNIAEVSPDKHEDEKLERSLKIVPEDIDAPASSTVEEYSLKEEEIREDKQYDGATEGTDEIGDVPSSTLSIEMQPEETNVHASSKFVEPILHAELDSQAGNQEDVVEESEDPKTETPLEIASEETDAPTSNEDIETISSAAVDFQEGSQEPNIAEVSPDNHEDEKLKKTLKTEVPEEIDTPASSTVKELSFKEEEIREDKHYDGATEGRDETGEAPTSILSKEVLPEETCVHASSKFVEPILHAELESQAGNQEDVVDKRDEQNTETSLEMTSEETDAPVSNEPIETISSAEVDFPEESQEPNLAEVSPDKHEDEKLKMTLKMEVPEEIDAPASSTVKELSFKEEEIREDKHYDGATESTDETGEAPTSILSKEVLPEEIYVHASSEFVEPSLHAELESQAGNQEGVVEKHDELNTETSLEMASDETDAPVSNEPIETVSSAEVDFPEESQEPNLAEVSPDNHENEELERSSKTAVPEKIDAPASSTIKELSFKEDKIGEDKYYDGATEFTEEIEDVPTSILGKEVMSEDTNVHASSKFMEPISHDELDSQVEGFVRDREDQKTDTSLDMASEETDAPASNEHIERISSAAVGFQEGCQDPNLAEASPDKHENENLERSLKTASEEIDAPALSTIEKHNLEEKEIREDKHYDGATEGRDEMSDVPTSTLSEDVMPEEISVHASSKFMEPISHVALECQAGNQEDVVEECEDQKTKRSLETASEETDEHIETISTPEIDFQKESQEPNLVEASPDKHEDENLKRSLKTALEELDAAALSTTAEHSLEEDENRADKHYNGATEGADETAGIPTSILSKEMLPEETSVHASSNFVECISHAELDSQAEEGVVEEHEDPKTETSLEMAPEEHIGTMSSAEVDFQEECQEPNIAEVSPDKPENEKLENSLKPVLEEISAPASGKHIETNSAVEEDFPAENREGVCGVEQEEGIDSDAGVSRDEPEDDKVAETSKMALDLEKTASSECAELAASVKDNIIQETKEVGANIGKENSSNACVEIEGTEEIEREGKLKMASEDSDITSLDECTKTIAPARDVPLVGSHEESSEAKEQEQNSVDACSAEDEPEDEKRENITLEEKESHVFAEEVSSTEDDLPVKSKEDVPGGNQEEEKPSNASARDYEVLDKENLLPTELDRRVDCEENEVFNKSTDNLVTTPSITEPANYISAQSVREETVQSYAGYKEETYKKEVPQEPELPDKDHQREVPLDSMEDNTAQVATAEEMTVLPTTEIDGTAEKSEENYMNQQIALETIASKNEIDVLPSGITDGFSLHKETEEESHTINKKDETTGDIQVDSLSSGVEDLVTSEEPKNTDLSMQPVQLQTNITSEEIDTEKPPKQGQLELLNPEVEAQNEVAKDIPGPGNSNNSTAEDQSTVQVGQIIQTREEDEEIKEHATKRDDNSTDEFEIPRSLTGQEDDIQKQSEDQTDTINLKEEIEEVEEKTKMVSSQVEKQEHEKRDGALENENRDKEVVGLSQENETLIKEEMQSHSSMPVQSDMQKSDLSCEEYREEKPTEEEFKPESIEGPNQELCKETEENGCSGNSDPEKVNEDDLSLSKSKEVDEIIPTTEDDIATKDNSATLPRVTGEEDCIPENEEDTNNSLNPEEQVKDPEASMKNEDQMKTEVKTEEELVSNDIVEQNVRDITEKEMKTEEVEKVSRDTQVDDLNEGIQRLNTWAQDTDNISEQCDKKEKVITSEENEKQEEPEPVKAKDILDEQSEESMGEGSSEKYELDNKTTDFTLLSKPEKVESVTDDTRSIKLEEMIDNFDQEEVDKTKTSPYKEVSNLEDEAPSSSRSSNPDILENVQVENAEPSETDLKEQCATEKAEELFEGQEKQGPQIPAKEDNITETEENLVPAKYSDNPQDGFETETTEQSNEATSETNATGTERKIDDNTIQSYVEKVPEKSQEGQHELDQEEEMKPEVEDQTEEIHNEDKTIMVAILTEEEQEAEKVVSEETIESVQGDKIITGTAEELQGSCKSDAAVEVKETAEKNATETEKKFDDVLDQSCVERVPDEPQEAQHELDQEEELKLEVEDHTEEIHNEDETVKTAILTEEEQKAAEKVVSEETIESSQGEKTIISAAEELQVSCNEDKSDAAIKVKEAAETNATETERKTDDVLNQSYVEKVSEDSQEARHKLNQEAELKPEVEDQTEEIHNEDETIKAAILTEEEQKEAEKVLSEETIETSQGEKNITSAAEELQVSCNKDKSDAAIEVKETAETNEATSKKNATETERETDDVLNQSYVEKISEESPESQHELNQEAELKPEVEDQTEEIMHNKDETIKAAILTEEEQMEAEKVVTEETFEIAKGEKTITSAAEELQVSCNEDKSDAAIEVKESTETNEATSETNATETERETDDVLNQSYVEKVSEEFPESQHELDQEAELKPEVEDQTEEIMHNNDETIKAAILTEEEQMEAEKVVTEETFEIAKEEKTITSAAEEFQVSCNEDKSNAAIEVKETAETNEGTSETNTTETERKIDEVLNQSYVEKVTEKSQEGQHELDQEAELKLEVEDQTDEIIHNEDETIKAAILTEEEQKEAEKVVSEETIESAQGDKTITSTAEELQGSCKGYKSDPAIEVKETAETNEATSETNATETERKIDDELNQRDVEKVSGESQEAQHELEKEEELKLEVEDQTEEIHNKDETGKAAILTEEEQKEAEEVVSEETIESAQEDKTITSTSGELQGSCNRDESDTATEVKETAALSPTDLRATCSVEQMKTYSEILEEEKQPSVKETVEEEKVHDGGTEQIFKVSTTRVAKEPTELVNKEIVEEVSTNSDDSMEASLVEVTDITSENIQKDDMAEQISVLNMAESTQFTVEGDATEKDHMMHGTLDPSSSIMMYDPSTGYHQKVAKERDILTSAEATEKVEELTDRAHEPRDQYVEEMASSQTTTSIKNTSEVEGVTEKEVTDDQTPQEQYQMSFPQPIMEEECKEKSPTTPEVEDKSPSLVTIKPESSENASMLQTEETCRQTEDSKQLEVCQRYLAPENSLISNPNEQNEEFKKATEVVGEQILKEEKLIEQHQMPSNALLHEHGYSIKVNTLEENNEEVEGPEEEPKAVEESCLQTEESRPLAVSQSVQGEDLHSESKSRSKIDNAKAVQEEKVSCIQTLPLEKSEETHQLRTSQEEDQETSEAIESMEQTMMEAEAPEDSPITTEEAHLQKEELKVLEIYQLLDRTHEDVGNLREEKPGEQQQRALLNEHGDLTKFNELENRAMGVEVSEKKPKATEEPCLQTEEKGLPSETNSVSICEVSKIIEGVEGGEMGSIESHPVETSEELPYSTPPEEEHGTSEITKNIDGNQKEVIETEAQTTEDKSNITEELRDLESSVLPFHGEGIKEEISKEENEREVSQESCMTYSKDIEAIGAKQFSRAPELENLKEQSETPSATVLFSQEQKHETLAITEHLKENAEEAEFLENKSMPQGSLQEEDSRELVVGQSDNDAEKDDLKKAGKEEDGAPDEAKGEGRETSEPPSGFDSHSTEKIMDDTSTYKSSSNLDDHETGGEIFEFAERAHAYMPAAESKESEIEKHPDDGMANLLAEEGHIRATNSSGTNQYDVQSKEESRVEMPTTECSTGIVEEIQPSDNAINGSNKMQIPKEEELSEAKEPIISTDREQAPEVPKDLGTANNAEAEARELGTEEILDDKEQHFDAHKETTSKHSLFGMMQRSTKERHAAGELAEFRETVVIQESIVQVEAGKSEKHKSDEEKDDEEEDEAEEGEEHKKTDSGWDGLVMVEAHKDMEIKTPNQKKSHGILSGMGSKVKHSISKVKKAITGKSSHSKQHSPT